MFVQFLGERVEMAKYSRADQVETFVVLLQKCLSISVGRQSNSMSRQATAVGARFR